jgi:CRP-like cAMP-binding protein/Ca2+-binding EF-hand superfamily protein
MLGKVYRELMILGFISLALVMSLEFDAWYTHNHMALMHFEFAHLLIFFWAMIYVANALICVFRLKVCRVIWDRVASTDTKLLCHRVETRVLKDEVGFGAAAERAVNMDDVREHDEDEDAEGDATEGMRPDEVADAIEAKLGEEDKGSWSPFWMTLVPYWDVGYEDLEWKIMQRIFLRNFKLPHEFDYTKYLRHKLHDALAHSLEVRPITWSIVITITLIYSGFAHIWTLSYYGSSLAGGDGSDAGDDGGHRRQLGGGGGEGAGGHLLTKRVAYVQVMAMLTFGWFLVFANAYVVYFVKNGIHTLLRHQGCDRPAAATLFLRHLDAQLDVRLQIPKLAVFADAGEDFAAAASAKLKVEFFSPAATLAKEGEPGDSMFFIVEGHVDIVDEASGNVLATLGPGNFLGEMSLLLGDPRSKSMIANDVCTVCTLNHADLEELKPEFPEVVAAMENIALKRRAASGMDKLDRASVAVVEEAVEEEEEHAHKHGGTKLPGMDKKKHGHGHGHNKMQWAEEILPAKTKRKLDILQELFLLLNCFYFSFYLARVMIIVIPITGVHPVMMVWYNILLVIPTVIISFFLAPMAAKYKCLLANVLERDDDLIAEVSSERQKIISLRNQMRTAMMHYGIKIAHEKGVDPDDITSGDVAKHAFETIDADGGGTLDYQELKDGLPQFGIFLKKDEFLQVCRLIDPNQDKTLEMKEWLHFMQATDDDLEGDDWRVALNAVKLRAKVKKALLDPAMALFWETAPTGADPPTIKDLVTDIFNELDEDQGGSLDFLELKHGLAKRDVIISGDEFKKLVELVDQKHTGDFNLAMFHAFMEQTDAELEEFERLNQIETERLEAEERAIREAEAKKAAEEAAVAEAKAKAIAEEEAKEQRRAKAKAEADAAAAAEAEAEAAKVSRTF